MGSALRGGRTLLTTSPTVRSLAFEAVVEVPKAMMAIRRSSFGDASRLLGTRVDDLTPPDRSLTDEERRTARQVGAVVRRIAIALGGVDTCFPQAIAAARMLERRDIPTFSLIGIKPGDTVTLDSHAWTIAGKLVVTGAGPHRSHDAVLAFDRAGGHS